MKNNKTYNKIISLETGNYKYSFPLNVFSNKITNNLDEKKIEKRLQNRNIYYNAFNKTQRKKLIKKIVSTNEILNFLLTFIKKEFPLNKIVSIYIYGSYFYSINGYFADDIDIGVILKGSLFRYILDKTEIPKELQKKLVYPVNKVSFFFYGEDNLSKGIQINDSVSAGLQHKQVVKREISIAYCRNIVVYGKDFIRIENNNKNLLVVLTRMLNGCYERLLRLKDNISKEDRKTTIKKIINRLVEVNIYLKFLDPKFEISLKKWFLWQQNKKKDRLNFDEIKKLYEETISTYNLIKEKIKN